MNGRCSTKESQDISGVEIAISRGIESTTWSCMQTIKLELFTEAERCRATKVPKVI